MATGAGATTSGRSVSAWDTGATSGGGVTRCDVTPKLTDGPGEPDAPAPAVTASGVAKAISDSTPAAMRPATLSVRTAPAGTLTWPRRTCTTTARMSCRQQAAQANQATATRAARATRAT